MLSSNILILSFFNSLILINSFRFSFVVAICDVSVMFVHFAVTITSASGEN
jgi:hypothetical protein